MATEHKSKATRRSVIAAVATASVAGGLAACARPGESPNATAEPTFKPIAHVLPRPEAHWVGDGFPVRTVFSPSRLDPAVLSPFILMDHAAPHEFGPTQTRRGVSEHPHRGFETVTFAYQGEIDHRDSHGGGGTIGAGGVQWMTAASGVVHEEMHSKRFSETGGMFEMVQLWVNLPARLKMSKPRYQGIDGASFPKLEFGKASGAGATGRLIAGKLNGKTGPAKTHTPITILDLELPAKSEAGFFLPEGRTVLVLLLEGRAVAQGEREVTAGELLVLDRTRSGRVHLSAQVATRALVLSGEPLNEPVVAHGPFVMNTWDEIRTAIHDYQKGRMGRLTPET